jgi:predicted nuclease of predicted toxin-antitoxin system
LVDELIRHGWQAVHWSTLGSASAADSVIMAWAIANQHIVFTHDLDFGTALALTQATGPSVIQVRAQSVLPEDMAAVVTAALKQYESELAAGALVVVELKKSRVRVVPL